MAQHYLAELDGAYDILVKLKLGTIEELKETIMGHLEKIHDVNPTVTLIAIEDTGRNWSSNSFSEPITIVYYNGCLSQRWKEVEGANAATICFNKIECLSPKSVLVENIL